MIMKKKVLAVLMVTALAITGLAACGSGNSGGSDNGSGSGGDEIQSRDIMVKNAKEAALADAGLTEEQTISIGKSFEYDDGNEVVKISLYTVDTDYEYEIRAEDSKILEKDKETPSKMEDISVNTPITPEDAAEIALGQVEGATMDNVRMEFDRDDGRDVFEVEIIYRNYDYGFNIDAGTGEIFMQKEEPLVWN